MELFDPVEDCVTLFPVEIVVYPNKTVTRYRFGERTFEERYSSHVLSRRRRKRLMAEQQRRRLRRAIPS